MEMSGGTLTMTGMYTRHIICTFQIVIEVKRPNCKVSWFHVWWKIMWDSGWCYDMEGDTDLLLDTMTTLPAIGEASTCQESSSSSPDRQWRLGSTSSLNEATEARWYIELSASPALVPVCIGCSLSLRLSAWRGTVNDVFVLRSTFVLSWFLEQHKQAWNLFCPPRKINK